jgi:hypothetical protein
MQLEATVLYGEAQELREWLQNKLKHETILFEQSVTDNTMNKTHGIYPRN